MLLSQSTLCWQNFKSLKFNSMKIFVFIEKLMYIKTIKVHVKLCEQKLLCKKHS